MRQDFVSGLIIPDLRFLGDIFAPETPDETLSDNIRFLGDIFPLETPDEVKICPQSDKI